MKMGLLHHLQVMKLKTMALLNKQIEQQLQK